MARLRLAAWIAAAAAAWVLFFYRLDGAGLLGPDEPRYAAVGREMARSGDWITPRLWGEPWFEKPALLYWMIAAGFRAGLGSELAPRLPVALTSVAFLAFLYVFVRREFGQRPAAYATAILATSAAWLAFSHVAVTDLPMAAAFSAAMLLFLPWIGRGERRVLPPAAALLGLAVFAKGLVPLALALPVLWAGRRRLRDLVHPAPIAAFLAVAAPWYLLVWMRHGGAFSSEFFLEHHFGRFATEALRHEQPAWFYLPVLLGALFPWTPLLVLAGNLRDPRRRCLAVVVLFGLVFFSISVNKLPGYLLPLVPALGLLMGLGLAESRSAGAPLAASVLMLGILPVIAAVLPRAIARGITHTEPPAAAWLGLLPALALAAVVWVLDRKGKRALAMALALALTVAGVGALKVVAFPVLDQAVSARAFWRSIEPRARQACVASVNRGWRYNLNYYSGDPLPDCANEARPLEIHHDAARGARIVSRSDAASVTRSGLP
jgi:4-amino-4-deoxy-L-arabinose transferase-like glycosyltransferase